ncbi:MAG: hypothetical protein WCJ96_01600 [Verrucomicrobiota bacterium]
MNPRLLLTCALLSWDGVRALAQEREPFEDAPINYTATQPRDRIARLNATFQKQADEIRSLPAKKRLRWLLEQLDVPIESQLLVFSKTSLQRNLISPETPRALFFSDEAYVGWAVGGGFEITVFDPELGTTFYLLDQHETGTAPLFNRSGECLLCHTRHDHTPSLRTRSVFPDANGEPLSGSGGSNIEPSTPLSERWGGWYVTGASSQLQHHGNIIGASIADFEGPTAKIGRTLPSLKDVVDTHRYPLNTSDIVALLMHDHQVHVHNVLATASQDARIALYRWPAMREILGLPVNAPPSGSCLVVFNSQADKVIEALLCKDEAAFPPQGIHGDGVFEKTYARTRKADAQNRSLRDLELATRLFRYRCSPLIYSQSFATLPKPLRELILRKLSAGLRAFPPSENFAHLDEAERAAIHEILTATLPDLPADWGK